MTLLDAAMPTLILNVEDHPLYADALHFNLGAALPHARLLRAPDLASARAILALERAPDLITLDLCLPDARGFEALIELRKLCPASPILVISAYCDEMTIRRGAHFGAAGFLSKCSGQRRLLESVKQILTGKPLDGHALEHDCQSGDSDADRLRRFSPQQLRVLQLICQGLLNKQIAFELGVSEATIKCHVGEIMNKLGVSTRTQVVAEIARAGLCQAIAFTHGEPALASAKERR